MCCHSTLGRAGLIKQMWFALWDFPECWMISMVGVLINLSSIIQSLLALASGLGEHRKSIVQSCY